MNTLVLAADAAKIFYASCENASEYELLGARIIAALEPTLVAQPNFSVTHTTVTTLEEGASEFTATTTENSPMPIPHAGEEVKVRTLFAPKLRLGKFSFKKVFTGKHTCEIRIGTASEETDSELYGEWKYAHIYYHNETKAIGLISNEIIRVGEINFFDIWRIKFPLRRKVTKLWSNGLN